MDRTVLQQTNFFVLPFTFGKKGRKPQDFVEEPFDEVCECPDLTCPQLFRFNFHWLLWVGEEELERGGKGEGKGKILKMFLK